MLFSRVLLLAILTLQGGDLVGAFAPSGVSTDSGHEALVASRNSAKSSNAAAINERHNYATASSSLSLSKTPTESEDFNISNLLNKALKGDTEAASTVLDKIGTMRQEGAQEDMTNLLNTILGLTDAEKMPFWTKFRITSKLSKRSRLVSLHRVLNISTPAPSSDGEDTEEAKQDRRRRAVVVALRSIVNASDNDNKEEEEEQSKSKSKGLSISKIEKLARKDLKQNVSSEDMKSRIPEGLETPKYDVIAKRPTFEIREYESFSVCSVPMMKSRPDAATTDRKVSQPQLAGASSFGALAGYLFGKNEEQKAMKMTTPVLTTGEGDQKEMAFVLPSEYWDSGNADADALSKAPSPLENSLVQLKKNEGGQRAVSMFGGFASSKEVEAKKKELLAKLASDSEWKPVDDAAVALAQYNDPFTPPWKRLSEVSVPVCKI